MKKHFLFAALFLAALVLGFAGCENPDDGIDNDVKYKLYAISNNSIMGTVVGSGDYKKGTEVTITAKPNDLYHLCTWSDVDTKDLVRKIVVNSDTVITAIFSDNPYLRVKSNNTSYGTVTGSGIYEIGSEVIITAATKGENFYFNGWSDCDSKESTREVVITSDTTIIANFIADPYLNVKPNDTGLGTVTGSGYYKSGTKVTITATPNSGVYFVEWNDDNTDNPRTVIVNEDITYIATFSGPLNGTENGYEWVSLGLPSGTKWATCNVGAKKPEEYGDYFAWGETEPKSDYSGDSYKFYNDYYITKYNNDRNLGRVDNKTTLELSDDAARVNWGGAWRMPTDAEWTELRNSNNCTWTWKSNYNGTGVAGQIVKSNINNESIFLPAAGYRKDFALSFAGSSGYYWSSSLYTGFGFPYDAWKVSVVSRGVCREEDSREYGMSVRPVCK